MTPRQMTLSITIQFYTKLKVIAVYLILLGNEYGQVASSPPSTLGFESSNHIVCRHLDFN